MKDARPAMPTDRDWYRDPAAMLEEVRRAVLADEGFAAVGGYDELREIHRGGQGVVYEALQRSTNRKVAVKVMREGPFAGRADRARFEREVRILAQLKHPNIVTVHDSGSAAGHFYYVMDYIDGEPLDDYVENLQTSKQQNVGIEDLLRLFAKVCDAVNAAHLRGVIHRDLKPRNVLIDAAGEPHVLDFGLAKDTLAEASGATAVTVTGQFMGSLPWAGPEQAEGAHAKIDLRTDVYSLGVMLYQVLTGRFPYEVVGNIRDVLDNIVRAEPAKPSTIRRGIDDEVETIVLKCLAKEPERRYQSAGELARDIRRYLAGEPIAARPATAWTRGARWIARHPVVSTAAACVGMAAVIIAATSIAVWLLNLRPYEVVRYRAGQVVKPDDWHPADEARLLSYNNRRLHTWGGAGDTIAFAELVERPAEFGGGKLALIGHNTRATNAFRGSLCAYDVDGDRDVPIWGRRIETDDVLEQLRRERDFIGEQFGIHLGTIADVFPGPDHPGDEVVAIFSNVFSQRVIRIYDLAGRLLYQVWHEGHVNVPYWMSDARLLVFAGDNAMVYWDRHGNLLKLEPDPIVVFALRPQSAYIGDDWLPLHPGDDPLRPVWYKCLRSGPGQTPVGRGKVRCKLWPPTVNDPGRFVVLDLLVDKELEAGVSWTLDEFGKEVPDTRVVGEAFQYNKTLPDGDPRKRPLPDPNAFRLGPLPPIVSASQPAEASPTGPRSPQPE